MPKTTLLGTRLRSHREARKWSQTDLEKRSGIPAVMISQFETGIRKNPSAATLKKLADALEVSMDYLWGRTDQATLVGGRADVLLRALGKASESTVNAVIAVGQTLTEQDRVARDKSSADEKSTKKRNED